VRTVQGDGGRGMGVGDVDNGVARIEFFNPDMIFDFKSLQVV